MLVALAESLQGGIIDADIATSLLTGIMASTDRFTATHTTSKSLTVAAQMMAAGARQQAVVRALYRDGKSEQVRSDRGAQPARSNDRHERTAGTRPERAERTAAERSERSERPAANERQAERPQAPRQEEPRQVREESRPVREEAREATRTQPAQETQPEPAQAVQTAPLAPPLDDEPVQRGESGYMPIIDPGHIELSEPEEAVHDEVAQEAPTLPMADFAAAAEILAERDNTSGDESDR
jgi:hypothetical protein